MKTIILNLTPEQKQILETALFNQVCNWEDRNKEDKARVLDNILEAIKGQ